MKTYAILRKEMELPMLALARIATKNSEILKKKWFYQ